MTIKLELLRTACYFTKLDKASLDAISRFIFEKQCPAKEIIFLEENEEKTIHFAISGAIKLFTTSNEGREFIVRIAYGGDSFNDDNLHGNGPNILGAATLSPVVLYRLSQLDLAEITHHYPQVLSNMVEVFAKREQYLVKLAKELVFKNITGRLAQLLLEKEDLSYTGDGSSQMTMQDMAFMIGTVREMVSRSLRDMEAMKAVTIDKNRIVINDREKLLELNRA